MSYNIHKGFSSNNKSFVLEEIKDSIVKSKSDILFLQEVVGSSGIGNHNSQFEFLADNVWHHYSYGKNSISPNSHHGNAILSKYPIVFSKNIDISVNNVEKRGMIHGIIEIPNTEIKIHVICTHLNLLQKHRDLQIKKINEYIIKKIPKDAPLILAGDFNDWKCTINIDVLKKNNLFESFLITYGDNVKTFPSCFPILKLDRIYYRNIELVSVDVYRDYPWNKLSDHIALSSEFKTI